VVISNIFKFKTIYRNINLGKISLELRQRKHGFICLRAEKNVDKLLLAFYFFIYVDYYYTNRIYQTIIDGLFKPIAYFQNF
jgi:hypothetical protein